MNSRTIRAPARRIALLALVVPLAVGLAGSGFADDIGGDAISIPDGGGDKSVTEKLLDILVASGTISQGQYDDLLRQSQEEQQSAMRAAASAAAEGAKGEKDWTFKWSNGFKLARNDGAFKLTFGGRMMLDGAIINQSTGLSPIGGDGNGFEFRRARIFFQGTAYERLFFKAQYDFAGTGDDEDLVDFKDLYIGLKKIGPLVRDVRVGHFKETMFLQEWTSSKYITFMERGLNSVFFPGRNIGLMAQNAHLNDKLLWRLGVYRNTNDHGFSFSNHSDWNITARLAGAPVYNQDGAQVLHLGAAYSHQFRGGDFEVRYRERQESHLGNRLVDTGGIPTDNIDLVNLEAAGLWGPFSVQTELTGSWVQGRGAQPDVHFWGIYAYANYFLTGEHRVYDLGNARFGRVKPRRMFNPLEGDWGAWEVAARGSYLDLSDENVTGGTLWDVTAGLNWYLFPNMRIMFNYVYSQLSNRTVGADSDVNGHVHVGQTRFQLDF